MKDLELAARIERLEKVRETAGKYRRRQNDREKRGAFDTSDEAWSYARAESDARNELDAALAGAGGARAEREAGGGSVSDSKITNPKIEALVAQRDAMLVELNSVRAELRAERLLEIERRYGIKEDTPVVSRGKRYLVRAIETSDYGGKPWVRGVVASAGGKIGTRLFELYTSWTVTS